MSGICGLWRKENSGRIAETLAAVTSGLSLASEAIQTETDEVAGVGLSARFATQQIYSGPRLLVACDAELYNEDELRGAIGDREQVPENGRTAALLASLYERFGCDFVDKLRGGFSVVLWDRRQRRMLAAIDGFGIKRLVYYQTESLMLVASRINALVRSGDFDPKTNPRAIPNILNFGANLAPATVFVGVHRLVPGTLLIASDGHIRLTRYWDICYGVGDDSNEERLSRGLESVVERSVAAHSKNGSIAELGAFLSGGTDSSTIVGMMTRLNRGPVEAFSIGFQEQPFNELGYAHIAAKRFDANLHTYIVGPEDCFEALPQMVRAFDEPFGNSSAIATYFCARLAARNGVKGLLAGDGGDELFGGNEWYKTDKIFKLYETIPSPIRQKLIEPFLNRLPFGGGLAGKARGYVRRANMPDVERVLSFQFLSTHSPASIFEADFLEALDGYSVLETPAHHYSQVPASDHLDRLLYMDMKITIGDSDLPKVTCMAELAGVQAKFPFLDRSVAEFSGLIPAKLKLKGFQKRYLFKRAFRNLLPPEIIRKKKHGFGIPVANWLKSYPPLRELARDTLLSRRAFERGYFRRNFIEDLFVSNEAEDSSYYGDILWTFLTLELWHLQMVDESARMAV